MTHTVGSRGATDMKEESVPRLLRPFRQRVSCVSLPAFLQPPQHQENEEADQDGFFHTTDDLCRRSVLLSDAEASGRRRHITEKISDSSAGAHPVLSYFAGCLCGCNRKGPARSTDGKLCLTRHSSSSLQDSQHPTATPLDSTSRAVHHHR